MLFPMQKSLFIEELLGLVYPNVCHFCQRAKATRIEGYLCHDCREECKEITDPFCSICGVQYKDTVHSDQILVCADCRKEMPHYDMARAAMVTTRGPILELIERYKYRNQRWYEAFLADLLCQCADNHYSAYAFDMVIPVPLHWTRKLWRGYNQSERLGRALAKHLDLPLGDKIIKKVKRTSPQASLDREERMQNLEGAFEVFERKNVNGKHILLVDDIVTTGATCSEVARVLKADGGAASVCVIAVCKGEMSSVAIF